ncbi:phosphoglycerate mutase [Nitrosomonas sp.]|uniref:phosphoglycerate mutase n=1 Tax=Nitrosomonas sp. TaxID=42353 RepID=UPI002638193B|nr:phosphoglycerate mutase [Nitrosomonas sp.]
MNLNLLIPNLFWPDASQPEIYSDLSIPSLEILLAKSTSTQHPSQEIEMWLCKAFNIAQQQNSWPIAPIMLRIDNPGLAKTSKDFWMRADPVHLRIEQNHIMLADNQAFEISKEEAEQIVQDLNHNIGNHYDFSILPLRPDRWYIRLSKVPKIQTYTLGQVTCMNINGFLPTGSESIIWHKIFNEIQMLLYEHPVNQARESRGELSINSVWFWGGGNMPQSIQAPYTHIWSDHDLPRALAAASNLSHSKLPAHADEWLQLGTAGNHLMVLDTLLGKAKYRNAYGWRETLTNLEKSWFSPLYKALRKGKIDQLTITTLNETSSQDFVIMRSNLWKFWLVTHPLSFYLVKH